MRVTPAAVATLLAVAVSLAGCGTSAPSDDAAAGGAAATAAVPASPTPEAASTAAATPAPGPATTATPAPATAGAWVDLAAYEADPAAFHANGDVVLFFNASWCPTCRQAVTNLDAEGVPPGLTVVSVDYDSHDSLRREYGVTVQHTFVQVDEAGQPLATFTGSRSGAEIAEQTA
jgi:thiol-disulfide isomerase/thioredoxin